MITRATFDCFFVVLVIAFGEIFLEYFEIFLKKFRWFFKELKK